MPLQLMNTMPRWDSFVQHLLQEVQDASPAVLTSAIEKLDLTHEQQLDFLFAAGAFGLVIATMPPFPELKEDAKLKSVLLQP